MSTSNEFEFGVLTATSEHNLLEASMSDGGLLLEMRCRSTMFGYHCCSLSVCLDKETQHRLKALMADAVFQ